MQHDNVKMYIQNDVAVISIKLPRHYVPFLEYYVPLQ